MTALARLLTQDVELQARQVQSTDAWGLEQPAWAAAQTVKGRLEHVASEEVLHAGETVVSEWRVFLEPDAQPASTGRVRVDGRTFDVLGEPEPVRGRTTLHHWLLRLRAVEG